MTSCRNDSNRFINYRHPHRHFCHNSRIWHPKTCDTVTRVLTRITALSWLVLHCIIPSRHYRFKACLCFAGTKHTCVWQLWPLFIIFRSYTHFIVYDRGISFAFLGPPGPDVYKSLIELNVCFGPVCMSSDFWYVFGVQCLCTFWSQPWNGLSMNFPQDAQFVRQYKFRACNKPASVPTRCVFVVTIYDCYVLLALAQCNVKISAIILS